MQGSETFKPSTPLLDSLSDVNDLRRLADADLRVLADELREETIAAVSATGGHLGAGLGVVELTVALHAVFDTPRDTLIFDVGHQCYPHKILTGRRERIRTLRQGGGLSGFTRRSESEHDPFGAAHSSTAMSAGLGFAVARDLGMPDVGDHVVCVVGDGAMSAGMAYEAMNNAGAQGRRLIMVLNDNNMSISPPVGALASYLARLRQAADRHDGRERADETSQAKGETLFEQLGITYLGPIDGHDIAALLEVLRTARDEAGGPLLVHVLTRKGKGYGPAERAADCYHGVGRFDIATGQQIKAVAAAPTYTKVFSDALIREAESDPTITAVTAAMADGTGLEAFRKQFPERFFDVGIAEQHGVTFCAGMAAAGLKPFCAIYSTFLQRGYDQIVHDVALQSLPVRFAIDRAGLVGEDGATHAGAFDLGYLCNLPRMVVMAAADEAELVRMVSTARLIDDRPSAFRFPRGEGRGVALPEIAEPLEIGRGRIVQEGTKVALLSLGGRLGECLEAAEELSRRGLSATVADARFAKPLDRSMILRLAREHEALVTIEEGAAGGFGGHVLALLAREGALDRGLRIRTMTLPDRFIDHAKPAAMYADAGLTASHIVDTALDCFGLSDRRRYPMLLRL